MHLGEALRATHHAVHANGKHTVHVIEIPDVIAKLYSDYAILDGLPDHDIVLMVVTGRGKPWMERRKMPESYLNNFGIRLDEVMACTAHDNSGSGFPQTLYSNGLLDDRWQAGQGPS